MCIKVANVQHQCRFLKHSVIDNSGELVSEKNSHSVLCDVSRQ